MRRPLLFNHQILLDGKVADICVDLSWIGSIDFSTSLRHLFLVEIRSTQRVAEFLQCLQASEGYTYHVATVKIEESTEVAVYSKLEDPFVDRSLAKVAKVVSDCFVTLDDSGRSYRSLFLPPEFRDLSVSFVEMVLGSKLTGRKCNMLLLTSLSSESIDDRIRSKLSELGDFTFVDVGADGLAMSFQVENLQIESQHLVLSRAFIISLEAGFRIESIEFDLQTS